jgi:hypothetical protein
VASLGSLGGSASNLAAIRRGGGAGFEPSRAEPESLKRAIII